MPQVRVQPGYTLSSRLATFQGYNLSRDYFVPLCGGGVAGTRTRKMLFVHFTIKCLLFTGLAVDKRSRARLALVGLASCRTERAQSFRLQSQPSSVPVVPVPRDCKLCSLTLLYPGSAQVIPAPGFRAGGLFSQNPWLRLTSGLSSPVPMSLAETNVLQAVDKSSGNRRWFSL